MRIAVSFKKKQCFFEILTRLIAFWNRKQLIVTGKVITEISFFANENENQNNDDEYRWNTNYADAQSYVGITENICTSKIENRTIYTFLINWRWKNLFYKTKISSCVGHPRKKGSLIFFCILLGTKRVLWRNNNNINYFFKLFSHITNNCRQTL